MAFKKFTNKEQVSKLLGKEQSKQRPRYLRRSSSWSVWSVKGQLGGQRDGTRGKEGRMIETIQRQHEEQIARAFQVSAQQRPGPCSQGCENLPGLLCQERALSPKLNTWSISWDRPRRKIIREKECIQMVNWVTTLYSRN